MTYYLAVDIGASSGRHILGHMENEKLVLEEIYRFPNSFIEKSGKMIWDIEQLVIEVKKGIKKCYVEGKIPKTVSIDTWGVDYVLLDKELNIIHPVYSYRDSRTSLVQSEANEIMSFKELYKKTGIQHQNFNTVYQLFCDQKSGRLKNAEHFLMIPEYIAYCLSGVIKSEYTNATTTSMINAVNSQWDQEIISAFKIKKSMFAPIEMPCTKVGNFTESMRNYAGFDASVILCPSHDTASAVAACPVELNSIYISSGTWSLIGTENICPIISDKSRELNFTNEGGVEKRYRVLKNIMGMWLFQNIRENLNKKYTYDEMMKFAMCSSCTKIFNVNDPSLTAPDNMIDTIKKLIGNNVISIADVINCTYHSLANSYKNAIEEIEEISQKHIDNIFIVGGGSKDKYLNLLTASYTGKRVFTGIGEATATGNILSQIMYDKKINLTQARNIVKSSFNIKEVID